MKSRAYEAVFHVLIGAVPAVSEEALRGDRDEGWSQRDKLPVYSW